MYRTCLVLTGIHKKNVMDDVFWMAVYNLSLSSTEGDMDRFYEILIPFVTGKPLEVSLVESELAANSTCEKASPSQAPAPPIPTAHSGRGLPGFGPWRTPQRAKTQYVRCLYHAIHFILRRRRGVSPLRCKQVGLALRLQMVEMLRNDLNYLHPDENGHKVCLMAFRQLSYRTVKIADALSMEDKLTNVQKVSLQIESCSICLDAMDGGDTPHIITLACSHSFHRECLDELVNSGSRNCPLCRTDLAGAGSVEEMVDKVKNLLESCQTELQHTIDGHDSAPAALDLDKRDAAWVGNALAYEVEDSDPNPGQVVPLQKFVAVDLLAIPQVVHSRNEAVSVLRVCDKLCTLLDNQQHTVKNTKHLTLSLIEHVFVHVLPIPKPRLDPNAENAEASRIAARSLRRREKEDAKKREIASKREEFRKLKGNKSSRKSVDDLSDTKAAEQEEEKARRLLEKLELFPGTATERIVCSQPCIWDEEISYELQVELLLVLQRLMEHFSSAVLAMQPSRSLDAVRVIVPGCICVIADAIIRRRAFDNPSVVCSLLMGLDANGRQLGVQGFGISAGVFATQTETIEAHTPELVCARAAILDYFDSPLQRKLDKIFHWEEKYELMPGRNLIKYFRMVRNDAFQFTVQACLSAASALD